MQTQQCKKLIYSLSRETDNDEILLQPYTYIAKMPKFNDYGLSKAFNHWLNVPAEKVSEIDNLVHMLVDAMFILDDIQDNSLLRRGVPTSHLIYGIPIAVNAASYAGFMALEKCFKLGHPDATQVCLEQVLEAHRGQGIEIYWRDNSICPTENQYAVMAKEKTALFTLSIKLMQLFSEDTQDYTTLLNILKLYMQILDDYWSLFCNDYMETKGYCEDISEGKFSFPIVHAIQTYPHDQKISNIIKQKTTDNNLKKYCVSLLKECGSYMYTQSKLKELDSITREEIRRLGGNPHLEKFLDSLQSKI